MIRKVKQSDLDALAKRSGVRVRYPEKKKPDAPEPQKPQEIVLTVPEQMLKPLIDALIVTIQMHEKTQADISEALTHINNNFPFEVEIKERDGDNNAKRFEFKQPGNGQKKVTH